MIGRYFGNILLSIDQLANTLIGGDPDETISSRAGKVITTRSREQAGVWHILCRLLHWIDPNHCEDAIEHDEGKNATWRRK